MLPAAFLEQLPFPLQQQVAHTLDQIERAMASAEINWPVFRVTPSRWERISELNEQELQEAGYLAELDADGQLVYRDRATLRQLGAAELQRPVLVSWPTPTKP